MTEINNNNNIPKVNVNKVVDVKNKNVPETIPTCVPQTAEEKVPDTGILGRSQVDGLKGADFSKSVDEAVKLAKSNPVGLQASEDIFEIMYDKFLNAGMPKDEAYFKATLAEEKFMETAHIE